MIINSIISVLCSYIIGAIPFSFIIAKANKVNIFEAGSGNPGASNVLRTVGKKAGILAYFCDIGKGMLAIVIAYNIMKNNAYMSATLVVCAIAVIMGHMYSIFLKFRGGKGVAAGCGVMLMLCPLSLLSALVFFFVGLVLSKKVIAVGSTCAAITLPIILSVYRFFLPMLYKPFFNIDYKFLLPTTILVMLSIIVKHIPNYKRLLKGQENSFGKK